MRKRIICPKCHRPMCMTFEYGCISTRCPVCKTYVEISKDERGIIKSRFLTDEEIREYQGIASRRD